MLDLETFIGLPLTGGGPSYTCERLANEIQGDGIRTQIFSPADRRRTIGTSVPTSDIIPRWARGLPFRVIRHTTMRLAELRLLRACQQRRSTSIAYLWGDVSGALCRELRREKIPCIREKYNCAKPVARDLLRQAYAGLGVERAFPAQPFSDEMVAREMLSFEVSEFIFCPSPLVAASLKEVGVPEEKLVLSSYGYDPERLDGETRALHPYDGPTFLFVGYICVRKGAHILLRAWKQAGIRGRLVLLGNMEPVLSELFADVLALDNVDHIPFTNDVGSYYRSADYFVFPSLEEGSPLVTYEASYCGLPAIVSPMAAGAVIRDGKEGIVIDVMTVDAWVEALGSAANLSEAGLAMAAAARTRALEYTWQKVGAARRQQILGYPWP